jgi:GDP-D-mannose dehydratase
VNCIFSSYLGRGRIEKESHIDTKLMKRTALVTGSEGFIGAHLVTFLHAKGWNVIGTYLQQKKELLLKSSNLQFARCDLRNGQRIAQILAKYRPTHIFHLGAQSLPTLSWEDPIRSGPPYGAPSGGGVGLFEC